jgi:hypothetical protein
MGILLLFSGGPVVHSAAAALQGNGTLTTDGTRVRFGAASLTGAGTSTVAGIVVHSGAATLTGTGSQMIEGTVIPGVVVPTDPLVGGPPIRVFRRRPVPQLVLASVGVDTETILDLSHQDDEIAVLYLLAPF